MLHISHFSKEGSPPADVTKLRRQDDITDVNKAMLSNVRSSFGRPDSDTGFVLWAKGLRMQSVFLVGKWFILWAKVIYCKGFLLWAKGLCCRQSVFLVGKWFILWEEVMSYG
jgi:hypothetical protein